MTYFFWKSPQAVFSIVTEMLGWRSVKNLSNCFCRCRKVESQAWATVIDTLLVGSGGTVVGHFNESLSALAASSGYWPLTT